MELTKKEKIIVTAIGENKQPKVTLTYIPYILLALLMSGAVAYIEIYHNVKGLIQTFIMLFMFFAMIIIAKQVQNLKNIIKKLHTHIQQLEGKEKSE